MAVSMIYTKPFTNNSVASTLNIMGLFVWLMGHKADPRGISQPGGLYHNHTILVLIILKAFYTLSESIRFK